MKMVLRGLLALVVACVVVLVGTYAWASHESGSLLSREVEVHDVDFPIPFPLTEAEIEALREERRAARAAEAPPVPAAGAEAAAEAPTAEGGEAPAVEAAPEPDPLEGVDLEAVALERAIARGQHLVDAIYVCLECHGQDLGGGTMIDDPAIGRLLGPNITAGRGGRTAEYTAADWDHIVRHGILPDGRPAAMPAEDFQRMSDRELSDVVAYIRSRPTVDAEVPGPTLGPLGTFLMATGNIPLAADLITDHQSAHAVMPPEAEPTAEFGRHLAGICTGCHRQNLEGGPIKAGPPDWLPAANLTSHADGRLAGWTVEDFIILMREGRRPDGSSVQMPMTLVMQYAQRMSDVELQALWAHIQTLPATPTGD